jgi:hypothetical protein
LQIHILYAEQQRAQIIRRDASSFRRDLIVGDFVSA